jgi:antitoxin ParD1/3/4
MTARARKKEDEAEARAAGSLDPEFVRMIRESLADPRPSIPAEEVFAELKARHEARLKRGA